MLPSNLETLAMPLQPEEVINNGQANAQNHL